MSLSLVQVVRIYYCSWLADIASRVKCFYLLKSTSRKSLGTRSLVAQNLKSVTEDNTSILNRILARRSDNGSEL